ncbi:hypothetical protein QLQ12_43930 [Actinoplanes sp. NEAU-A12]|uniref:Uncharacterized protein n=1 Tax=Actinoplanes sandaracinus TaxID=3045177 RepID=A0ABT6X0M1_9ACTN|nr:hypothetical protein [Actinoplanes sandaracinus]MDI6105554.1 hypothetical protein [Actinoplanes sandaracinus]
MGTRNRHYATDLTGAEQRILDELHARIPAGAELAAPLPRVTPHRRRASYLSVAAAVVLLTTGSALIALQARPERPAGPPAATTTSAAWTVDQLVTALTRAAEPATSEVRRRALTVVISRDEGACRISATEVEATPASTGAPRSAAGTLRVRPARPPAGLGCATNEPAKATHDGPSDDLARTWRDLVAADPRLARAADPVAVLSALRRTTGSPRETAQDPAAYGTMVGKLCAASTADCAALTWTLAVELLSDPAAGSTERATAVRHAAAAAQPLSTAGATLRVPYLPPGETGFTGAQPVPAELTFDPATGALRRLTITDAATGRTEMLLPGS